MRNSRNLILIVVALVLIGGGILAYSVLREPEAASTPIQAVPLATSAATAAPQTQPTTAPTAAPTAVAQAAPTVAPSATTAPAVSGPILAQIVPEESEVRFIIDEVLNNAPKTVVGTTNQVAGELSVDPNNPAASQVGVIQVNARTLATDNDFRNRAIKNRILMTDQYEFISFKPIQLTGLPDSVTMGQSYTFKMTGDLTIRDTTKPVTFDVTVTPESTERLKGTAIATVAYADFGLTIPQVQQVASVADNVRLEIDFVAVPKG